VGPRLAPMSRRRPFDPQALRAARLGAGLTQHELAREIGVAGGERISLWELGKTSPHPRVVPRLAAALQVRVEDLLQPGVEQPDLRELRTTAGLSLRSLADLTHLSKTTLIRWELEGVAEPPTHETLSSYASALNVSVEVVRRAMSRSHG
jgi:transcriptional regulator with XRE-family HTH domain